MCVPDHVTFDATFSFPSSLKAAGGVLLRMSVPDLGRVG